MKKKSVVIGSILKPVDDVRHYHKLALSMAKTNKYDINIIGFNSKNSASHPNIVFHPIFSFKRLSPGRFTAPLRFFRYLIKVRPELVVVNTAELLPVAISYKILFGGRIVYDIQENYHLNILHLSPLPPFLKHLAAAWIRFIERLTAPGIDHFLLAEKSYASLPFVAGRWTVLENKSLTFPEIGQNKKEPINKAAPLFLFSGTLSLKYGLAEAVEAFRSLQIVMPESRLLICGKTHDKTTQEFLNEVVKKLQAIELIGGRQGIDHEVVRNAIRTADAALVFYPENPAIDNCFPTKIWEYMAGKLPMLIQANKNWTGYCLEKRAGFIFQEPKPSWVSAFLSNDFYPTGIDYSDIFWAGEEVKLQQLADKLLT